MSATGIYVSPTQFVSFAGNDSLTGEIAVRSRAIGGFSDLLQFLPNPDPILKSQGKDISVYRDLRVEAIVGGPLRRRTSAVQALEYGLEQGRSSSRVFKAVRDWLQDAAVNDWIAQFVEAAYFGYAPQEIIWNRLGGMTLPDRVVAKPQEWFVFGTAGELRFRSLTHPLEGEALPDHKFLCPRQAPSYQNPYGFPDLSMVFWPMVFKKGGMKFWLKFTEKYGMPWAVGKVPRSAGPDEEDALLDSLSNMIQDAVAVIPDDSSVELMDGVKSGNSADLYERLVMYCRSEVNIALTGTNQTTESDTNRTLAGIEVASHLRDATAEIVVASMNELIRYVVSENWGGPAPLWSMWDQEARDRDRAARDKSVSESGARLSNRYWMRAYGYEEGDLGPEAWSQPGTGAVAPVAFADNQVVHPTDYIDAAAQTLESESAGAWSRVLDQVKGLALQAETDGKTLAQFRDQLLASFADLDTDALAKVMEVGFSVAELAGRFDVKNGH